MKRVFERKVNYLQSIERYIVEGDLLMVQMVFDETTTEAEARLGMKVCDALLQQTNGEIKGDAWKEWSENILEMGWCSAKEFIQQRIIGNYTEIKEG